MDTKMEVMWKNTAYHLDAMTKVAKFFDVSSVRQ